MVRVADEEGDQPCHGQFGVGLRQGGASQEVAKPIGGHVTRPGVLGVQRFQHFAQVFHAVISSQRFAGTPRPKRVPLFDDL
ncbi:hypothetical protein [Streptomyces sp. SID3343]|uniref:hypothetical protein n=1 Tax=Streptomyces sp. SID3343 TaxID=2690260 RepID=UPI00136BB44A|nr:hypothetical protein [Streptomyces sp. SID3343]MYV96976.1 hypothetical protein [Streptomyces sp. SID3343]MYW06744.1 hypothetical protein [Streptomyces sp. SID3343]